MRFDEKGIGRGYQVVEDEIVEAPCISLQGCECSRSSFKGYSALDAAHVDGHSVCSYPSAEAVGAFVESYACGGRKLFSEVVGGREPGEAAAYDGDFLVRFAGGIGAGEERFAGVMFLEEGGSYGGDVAVGVEDGTRAYPR